MATTQTNPELLIDPELKTELKNKIKIRNPTNNPPKKPNEIHPEQGFIRQQGFNECIPPMTL